MRATMVGRVFALGFLLLAGPAGAVDFVIANGDVAALVTAIDTANGNGTTDVIILADTGAYTLTTAAETGTGLPAITSALTIEGNGATISRSGAAPTFRIFTIGGSANVTFRNLTISNGDSGGRNSLTSRGGNIAVLGSTPQLTLEDCIVSGGIAGIGAGIFVEPAGAVVTLTRSFVVNNLASRGAAIALDGAATLTLDRTYVGSNSAVDFGGGGGGGAVGGGILTLGAATVTITDSAVSGNGTSPAVNTDDSLGAGISDLGGATYTITRSELIGNLAQFSAVANHGGAIYAGHTNGTFRIANATLTNNTAGNQGGAIANLGGADVVLRNVTIAGNFAQSGGGVALASGNGGTVTLANSILSDNTAAAGTDCAGPITSLGYNLYGDTGGCSVTTTTGDLVGLDVLLAGQEVDPNGNGTTTLALLVGSPAIEGGDPAGCKDALNVDLTTDQRGLPRPVNARCDIGAFERQPVPEDCDNCLDDDGDGLVDRDDTPACRPLLDAGGTSLGDPQRGKALGKCAATLAKAGAKLVNGEIKRLHKCMQTAFTCVQQKPGDAKCLAKGTKVCQAAFVKRQADLAKYATTLRAKCGPPALATDDLLAEAGLGFGNEQQVCAEAGFPSLASIDDVAACAGSLHVCRAQQIVNMQEPRAQELIQLTQIDANAFPCIEGVADGQGVGRFDPADQKKAVACEKTLTKAGAKFVSGKLKLAQGCALAVSKCRQEKAGDPKCLPKAQQTCGKALAKLTGPGGLEQKLAAAIAKSCAAPPLDLATLLSDEGIGFGVQKRRLECGGLGAGQLDDAAAVASCLNRQHECRVEQALEAELPRWRELLTAGGITLP